MKNISEEVKLQVFNQGYKSNELVGTGTCQISDFCRDGVNKYDIYHEELEAGTIRI